MRSLRMRMLKATTVFVAVSTVLSVAGLTVSGPALADKPPPKPSVRAFTTTNPTPDGPDDPGMCSNGNEAVNCNQYNGKEFVWLNGGPNSPSLDDGTYFFSVIEPGSQPDPNDDGDGNLSDVFDTSADRTFSVVGGVIFYTGTTHDFDNNKIRLMPYAETTNPGGVYIMAICRADVIPADPSGCAYDMFKVGEGDDDVTRELDDLTVTKDAAGTDTRTYVWTIAKDVNKTYVQQVGGNVTFHYTVTVTPDGGTVSDVSVTGGIQVFNPNTIKIDEETTVPIPVGGVNVTDELSDGTVCEVLNGDGDPATNQTLTQLQTNFTYSCDLGSSLPSGALDNTASVSWDESFGEGTHIDAGSAEFLFEGVEFTETAVDDCVDVTDTYKGDLGSPCTDGSGTATSYEYDRSIAVGNGCQSYDNTASFTADSGATDSASQTVTVCGPVKTGALTIGFWKNVNGNNTIERYCAPAGKPSLATYLSGLGAGNGPFKDALGKSCLQLVTYVNAVIKGANSTNMNVMLRAQMLATALDVYFSNSALGYTTTSVARIKPPSSFLPNAPIGSFNMDMTAICPMVDNSTTGTASCTAGNPSTDAFASGAVPAAAMTVQAILGYESTTPVPFNGSTSSPVWYGGNRTKQEIAKNIFDQINNQLAFGA